MIATRSDLTAAKALLDNLDQVNAAIANLGKGTAITIALVGSPIPVQLTVSVADALAFLQSLQTKLIAALKDVGVAV